MMIALHLRECVNVWCKCHAINHEVEVGCVYVLYEVTLEGTRETSCCPALTLFLLFCL